MDTKIPPPIVAALTLAAMWLMHQRVKVFIHLDQIPAAVQSVLFSMFVGAGILLTVSAIRGFKRADTTVTPLQPEKASKMVISGPYRFTRNPMYLGLLCALLAATVWFGNAALLILCAGFVWYITVFQIKPEEAALTRKFGDTYLDYKTKVRRWI